MQMEFLMLIVGAFALFQLALTAAVYGDARRIRTARLRGGIAPELWACATLFGGAITTAIYWKLHYSPVPADQSPQGGSSR